MSEDPEPGVLCPSQWIRHVIDANANAISAFAIDSASGALQITTASPFPTGVLGG